ncbi:metallophosphoesterase family protein [Pedobacter sp. HDW13]|uniref:purple acid phosphatase family protein n=1 Tax=Pedobacter sp. HDW13 TaxID=2714940 RepID=UPI00140D69DE|nr:metallophosphoesterase family protein [Pedobacter sp. HDW13]QIL41311.1 metallophosphoesterase family protein [Pedobacter sp. HDW13]
MNKIILKISLVALFCIGYKSSSAQPFQPTSIPDRIILTWSADPATTQSVTWRTDSTVNQAYGQVLVESSSPKLEKPESSEFTATTSVLKGKEYASAHYHSITFTGLQPDKVYTYRVGDGKNWSEWFQFKTAPAQDKPFSFIYLGDAQNDIRSKWSRVIRRAFATHGDASFIVHAGDLINRSNNDNEWGEWHFGGGFINGMIPSIPSSGNHEYFRDEEKTLTLDPHWRAQYTLPENGPDGLKESVYYVDYANVRIISLNSQMIVLDSNSLKIQAKWLEDVLKNNPKKWTMITYHHPIYSTAKGRDNKEFRAAFKPLFDKYHVDLLMQGHDHTYSRGQNLPTGTSGKVGGPMYVVSVAGPKMYKIDVEPKWMDVFAEDTQLFQIISVNGDELNYTAYKASGEVFDSFKLVKKLKNKAAVFTDTRAKNSLKKTK